MREIKFRVWILPQGNRVIGEMVYLPLAGLNYFDFEGSYALSFAVDGYDGFWAHECYDKLKPNHVLMQYTGLKDKNGKEIYESDIIQFNDSIYGMEKWVVIWDSFTGFSPFNRYRRFNDSPYEGYYLGDKEDSDIEFEVIGNIYENPELIK